MTLSLSDHLLANIKIAEDTGCWNWVAVEKYKTVGYGKIWTGRKTLGAHRVSYEIYCGPIPAGMHVCHRCDNPACVNPKHLFLGTPTDNLADMRSKGRWVRSATKLADRDVLAIRAATVVQHKILADKYGVSEALIRAIRKGIRRFHVTEQSS